LRTVLWQWADKPLAEEEKAILQDLLQVLQKDPSEILELITDDEFDALVMRIQRLLEQERFPSPSEDWPAVPWPPF